MKAYPKWFLAFIWCVVVTISLSGIALVPKALELRFALITPFDFNSDLSELMRVGHAVIAFAYCTLIGALWASHMRLGWRKKSKLKTGLTLGLLSLVLIATALILYYSGDDAIINPASLTHIVLGVMFTLLFLLHFFTRHSVNEH